MTNPNETCECSWSIRRRTGRCILYGKRLPQQAQSAPTDPPAAPDAVRDDTKRRDALYKVLECNGAHLAEGIHIGFYAGYGVLRDELAEAARELELYREVCGQANRIRFREYEISLENGGMYSVFNHINGWSDPIHAKRFKTVFEAIQTVKQHNGGAE